MTRQDLYYIYAKNAKKFGSVQFCGFWQRMAEKFGSVGFRQCSSSVDHYLLCSCLLIDFSSWHAVIYTHSDWAHNTDAVFCTYLGTLYTYTLWLSQMTCYRESRLRVQCTLFTLRYNQLPGMNTTLEMGLL